MFIINLYTLWIAVITDSTLKVMIKNKGNIASIVQSIIYQFLITFLCINTVFFCVEVMIFGYGFKHSGDDILMSYLTVEFVVTIIIMLRLRRDKEAYFIA